MIIKCKMCGGDILFQPGDTYGTCDSCDSVCTIPKVEDEQGANRYNRANHFRRQCEFDKAIAAYEKILESNEGDAEAHFGIVLSRFGIEYVEDPATGRRVPTCHRVQVSSILADADYLSALENAPDHYSRELYETQAHEIADIQKGILAISGSEKPYDVFICYKETDAAGSRTRDSQLAQDIYYALTEEGYRVFFSRITLEDKLGRQYEPYIFAALHSAKVMLVVGTKPEHFSAVWVKNEWSRYLALMRTDRKRLLIPCYRDMDPYDLPDELSSLQSQDMGRIGFIQDLIRGIKKVLDSEKPAAAPVQQTIVQQAPAEITGNISALLDRAFMALEDGEFDQADEFCEQVLNQDARNARAYLGKLMAALHVKLPEQLSQQSKPFDKNGNYQKALRFGDDALKAQLQGWMDDVKKRAEHAHMLSQLSMLAEQVKKAKIVAELDKISENLTGMGEMPETQEILQQLASKKEVLMEKDYQKAVGFMKEENWSDAIALFRNLELIEYLDAAVLVRVCREKQRQQEEENAYQMAMQAMQLAASQHEYLKAAEMLECMIEYKNAREKQQECYRLAERAAQQEQKQKEAMLAMHQRTAALRDIFAVSTNQQHTMHVAVDMEGNVYPSSIANEKLNGIRHWKHIVSVSAGKLHVLGLRMDGTAMAVGSAMYSQIDVESWQNLTDVAAGGWHSLGLKTNGTVVAAGSNENGQCNVDSWRNVVKIAAGNNHSVALKEDGTVVAAGCNEHNECNVGGWLDVVDIFARNSYTVGLKKDGTVLCTHSKIDVSGWKKVIDIALGCTTVMGLCKDGTVLMADMVKNFEKKYSTAQWHDIVAISVHNAHMVGLKADGTVVATGYNHQKQCNVSDLQNVVAVSAGEFTTVAIREDGMVVVVGQDIRQPYTEVSKWPQLFENPDTYQQDRRKLMKERGERMKKGLCPYCGGEIKKGLFFERCKNCGKTKDY